MGFGIFIGLVVILILFANYFTRDKPPYWIQRREKRTGKKVSINVIDEEDDCHKPKIPTLLLTTSIDRSKNININKD